MSAERTVAVAIPGAPDSEQTGLAESSRAEPSRAESGQAESGQAESGQGVAGLAESGSRPEAAVARLIRARGLAAGTPHPKVAAQIAGQCGSSMIRAYRLALGIALADVVAQVRARYEADGRRVPRFSETLLSAYEGGQKRPGPEYLHYLCATYQADPADLGFDGFCLCGGSHRPRPAPVPGPRPAPGRPAAGQPPAGRREPVPGPASPPRPDASGPGAPSGDADDDELRRMLIGQMTTAGCRVDSRFLGAVDRIRRRLDDALSGGTVSAATIDTWEQAAAGYGQQYMTVPSLRLLCDVLLDLADVRRRCQERQPLEYSERLCRLASQLAGLAGITMLDLGDHRLARSFFRTARTAADETGDRQLRAWVAVREALVPLYYGDPREAQALAGSAADLAGRHLCAAAVMAPVIEARAQARLAAAQPRREPLNREPLNPEAHNRPGRHRAVLSRAVLNRAGLNRVRAALDKAADAIADLPPEHRADTALGYTERQLYFHSGDALAVVGDWQGASRAFSLAAQLYPAAEVLDSALVSLGQARCLLDSGEPGQALALGRDTVLGLPAAHRTDVILQVARQLGHAAAERYPSAAGLAEFRDALARH